MATRRVSVEISNSAVRMAEVVVGGGRPELLSLGQVGFHPGLWLRQHRSSR